MIPEAAIAATGRYTPLFFAPHDTAAAPRAARGINRNTTRLSTSSERSTLPFHGDESSESDDEDLVEAGGPRGPLWGTWGDLQIAYRLR